jgi:predicted RNA-binding protein associated with RNAse of E/G family
VVTRQPQVVLVPRAAAFVATFYDEDEDPPCDVYVDITTVPVWSGATVTSIDLDLDVVRGTHGRVWVDDEDEFADHRTRWAYPPDVVALATETCEAVRAAVSGGAPPYDGRAQQPWLDRLRSPTLGP